MSASVYMACSRATRSIGHGTARLALDTPEPDTPRALEGGMMILARASLPLYAIRQQDAETEAVRQD
jgi:hypothetical protein